MLAGSDVAFKLMHKSIIYLTVFIKIGRVYGDHLKLLIAKSGFI